MVSLKYNGTAVIWTEDGREKYRFDATSGMSADVSDNGRNYQSPKNQCVSDAGPIPAGTYVMQLQVSRQPVAVVADAASCQLKVAAGIQQIPTGSTANSTERCTPYWQNWGYNRVRLEAYDAKARKACGASRSGFYIHDSHKGFTHGCIEVQHLFFKRLYDLANAKTKQKQMFVIVDYGRGSTTRGNTKTP